MEYPFFEVPRLGGALLIAAIAITHVVIAHFAVGSGIYLAVTHTYAHRAGDTLLLRYLKDHVRFLVLFSFVAGALTGVGIWITIGLVSPMATSRLIHNFVWAWAIEWCFFVIEIAAGYVYYYGWGRLHPRQHVAVAWVYAVSAFMSLFVINGILTFMLTPSRWGEMIAGDRPFHPEFGFWLGLFNDTFWPSLILRTISSLALATIFIAVIVNLHRGYTREERRRIINQGAYFMIPLALMAPVALWYFNEIPAQSRRFVSGGSVAMMLFLAFGTFASIAIGLYAYFGLLRGRRYINLESSLLLLAFALLATGSMEFVREGIRKPYLIYSVLYSNGIPAIGAWPDRINREGLLTHTPFVRDPDQTPADLGSLPLREQGRYVFAAQCRSCHEIEGYNGLRQLVVGRSRHLLLAQMRELEKWGFMPPFHGTELEMKALVEYQLWLSHGDDYEPPPASYLRSAVSDILASSPEPTPRSRVRP